MSLHPRTIIVNKARNELSTHFREIEDKYDLTYGEMTSILSDQLSNLAMYQIRSERHPDEPNKKGDEL